MKLKKALIVTSLASALIGAGVMTAQARTSPASNGRANPATSTNEDCLRWDTGVVAGSVNRLGLRNICANTITWNMPLVVDNAQSFTVRVRVREASAQGFVSCTTRVRDFVGGQVGTDDTDFSTGVFDEELVVFSEVVPFGGTMDVSCSISPNSTAKIMSVDWI